MIWKSSLSYQTVFYVFESAIQPWHSCMTRFLFQPNSCRTTASRTSSDYGDSEGKFLSAKFPTKQAPRRQTQAAVPKAIVEPTAAPVESAKVKDEMKVPEPKMKPAYEFLMRDADGL